jgi:hypothetical protein
MGLVQTQCSLPTEMTRPTVLAATSRGNVTPCGRSLEQLRTVLNHIEHALGTYIEHICTSGWDSLYIGLLCPRQIWCSKLLLSQLIILSCSFWCQRGSFFSYGGSFCSHRGSFLRKRVFIELLESFRLNL